MAGNEKGPVKPPVLDMKARKSEGAEDTAENKGGAASTGPAPDGRPETGGAPGAGDTGTKTGTAASKTSLPRPGRSVLWAAAGGAGGAVIGAALAYAIAAAGYWPALTPPAAPDETASDIAALSQRIDALETSGSGINGDVSDLGARIDGLAAKIDNLPAPAEPAAPVDLAPLQARIDRLETEVSALAGGAASEDAENMADRLAGLGSELASLQTGLDRLRETSGENARSLGARIDDLEAKLAETGDRPSGLAASAGLPLALGGLDDAIRNGRPFAGELAALTAALPDLAVPEAIAAGAETGLADPRSVGTRLERAIPDILAARPHDPDAGWQDRLMDRARALLALRPAAGAGGTGPDAEVARLEDAVGRRDFAAAATALAALPQPMQDAAGPVAADIRALAAADRFAAAARAAALASAAPAAGETGDAQ